MHRIKHTFAAMLATVASAFLAIACGVDDPEEPLKEGEGDSHTETGDHTQEGGEGQAGNGSGQDGDTTGTEGSEAAAHEPEIHEGEITIAAESQEAWVYFAFHPGVVLEDVGDPAASNAWDLAFRRTQIATNSGASGGGKGGALSMKTTAWDAVSECPADGYAADEELPIPGPPGSGTAPGNPVLAEWFDYDPATHAVSSKGTVYCIRRGAGDSAGKLRVESYASGKITIKYKHFHDE